MNILFEIADRDLMIIGVIFVAILIVAAVIFKVALRGKKVKPIGEDERFDSEADEEVVENTDLTEEQKEAKNELEKVYRQMSIDLEKQEEKVDNIDDFEREQEENAIISYQELMAKAEKLKQETNKYEEHAENLADIEVNSAMDTYKEHTNKVNLESKKETHAFKNSDIISPIYGIQKDNEKSLSKKQSNDIINKAYENSFEQSEKEQNIDFLNSLKEFRKNL